MQVAALQANNELLIDWTGPVDVTNLAVADFNTEPTFEEPATIAQAGPTGGLLTFSVNVDGDTHLTYDGTEPGVLTPQTIAIT